MSSAQHTPGPWAWRSFGGLTLCGDHGRRPIILDARRGELRGRDERGLMVPLDPQSADARLIVASPRMAEVLRGLAMEPCRAHAPSTCQDQPVVPLCLTCDAREVLAEAGVKP